MTLENLSLKHKILLYLLYFVIFKLRFWQPCLKVDPSPAKCDKKCGRCDKKWIICGILDVQAHQTTGICKKYVRKDRGRRSAKKDLRSFSSAEEKKYWANSWSLITGTARGWWLFFSSYPPKCEFACFYLFIFKQQSILAESCETLFLLNFFLQESHGQENIYINIYSR